MGLLSINCAICGSEANKLLSHMIANNEHICGDCFQKTGKEKELSIMLKEDVQNLILERDSLGKNDKFYKKQEQIEKFKQIANEQKDKKAAKFNPTKKIDKYIYVDEKNELWSVPINKSKEYHYEDLLSFDVLEDGNSIVQTSAGRSIAGGLVFGVAGAVVGGIFGKKKAKDTCTKLQVKATVNDIKNSVQIITLIDCKTDRNSSVYKNACKQAQEISSTFEIIINMNSNRIQHNLKKEPISTSFISSADEIKKYKELLDIGAISKDEFETKKKELLNM